MIPRPGPPRPKLVDFVSQLTQVAQQFDRPDLANFQNFADKELHWLEEMQGRVGYYLRRAAFLRISIIVVATVLTAGITAPEGASAVSVILVSLGNAAIMTGANIVADYAVHKPLSLREITIDFSKNILFFSFLHVLNQNLFELALNYPGQTLKRLAILFAGGGIAAPLPELLIERLRTGAFPDHMAFSFAASGLLSAIVGAIVGPKVIEALDTLDRVQAELRSALEALAAEREAWLADLGRAGTPGANQANLEAVNRRGEAIYRDFDKLAEAMEKLPEPVLERLNLPRPVLADLRTQALRYANKIAALSQEPPPGGKLLAAPTEIVPNGLLPAGGNTFEFNPNTAGLDPRTLLERFREAGYQATESGGVLHLIAPGETTPRYVLLPVRSDIPAPVLAKLITRRGTYAANVLDIVRAQSAFPALERMLADIANSKPGIARTILEGMGRHKITDEEAIRGIGRFLEAGGKPETLAVAVGNGNRFGARETIATLRKFGSLTPAERKGIDKIVELHGVRGHGTDSIVGVGAHYDPAGPIYAAIDELAPYTEHGLGQFIDQLASADAGRRREAEGALNQARELLAKGASPKLLFDRRTVDGVQALRVRDVSEDSVEAYLVAVRNSTGPDSLVGASWDYTRFPKGPRHDWQPKDPINMPDSSGVYPTYDTGKGRFWRNRAAIEIEARAQGVRAYRPSSTDPVSAMSDADLVALRDTPTSQVRSPRDPITGRPWELEHVRIQQRVGRWLEDAGFPPSEARRLSSAADPGNLMDVSQIEHAFLDAGAHRYPHRTDVTGRTWSDTAWADSRAREPLTEMTDEVLTEIVTRANPDTSIRLGNAPDFRRALGAEIARRRLPLTIR